MLSETVLALSHWQMTLTSLLHLVFIPLSLGLSLLLTALEIRLWLTADQTLKPVVQFWARLLVVQLALLMSTRLLILLQFGVNTSFFAHFAGDNFALPLAIEACGSFVLISALFGPFWFGWSQLSDKQHAFITALLSLTLHVSTLWLISAYAWLDHPSGAEFNPQSLHIETSDSWQILNPSNLGERLLHQLGLSYAIAAGLIISLCAGLSRQHPQHKIMQSSQRWAAIVGILAWLAVAVHGQANTETLSHRIQQNTLRGLDNRPLLTEIQTHIRNGLSAYRALQAWREDEKNAPLADSFDQQKVDLGYALLLKRSLSKIENATEQHIKLTAESLLPKQASLIFWSHKSLMIGAFLSLIGFILAAWPRFAQQNVLLLAFPLNLLLAIMDVIIAQIQRQPWLVEGLLPEYVAYSTLSLGELVSGCLFYGLGTVILIGTSVLLSLQIIHSTRASGDTQ